MQWLLLGIVAVALVFLSIYHPKTAFSMLFALGLAVLAAVYLTFDDGVLSRTKLPTEAVAIENAVVAESYGGSFQFNARLVNRHQSVLLKGVVVSITMLDCPAQHDDDGGDDGECAVIGQRDAEINAKIPPGQARDISRNLAFDAAKPQGELRWRFLITRTRS